MGDKYFTWIKVLSFFGIVLGLYLLWEQGHSSSIPLCNINSTVNCDAIITGPVSKTFGIPTPLIGLVGYVAILVSSFKKNMNWVLGMASFGLAFCLYIGFREIFELRVACPVCILCLLDMIVTFILSIFLKIKSQI